MLEIIFDSIPAFWPEITIAIAFVLAMILEFSMRDGGRTAGVVALAGFFGALLQLPFTHGAPRELFGGMIALDPFAVFFKYIILLTAVVIVIFALQSEELKREKEHMGEFFCFIIALTLGMLLMSGASNLLMIYLSIEFVSITSYILAGFSRGVRRSAEAALKYVLYGGAASGVMLYGMSLIYGLTGSLDLGTIQAAIATGGAVPAESFAALILAIVMMLAGFGYKISAVPFHYWTPDVYEGAPITVTAFLAVASKSAGFAIMIRFFYVAFFDARLDVGRWASFGNLNWNMIIAAMSVATMTVGNFVAIWQDNLKRMLAYSSIAHAGYLLMGLVVMSDLGLAAILVYLAIYFCMNLGAFFVVMAVAERTGSEHIDDYRGLAARSPIMAASLSIFLISLTGLPPFAGFLGKWMLFSAVMDSPYIWLAIVGVINSAVSLYYYARVFRNMYLREPQEGNAGPLTFSPVVTIIALLLAAPNLLLILNFGPLVSFAQRSVSIFLR
jgi:NADH-quinone oxidoreductase subunit N